MKRKVLYSIIFVLLLAITVTSATFAFFIAATNQNTTINADSSKYEIIYTGGTQINGNITIATNKDGGYNTTVNIRTSNDSVHPKANLYIDISTITSNMAVDGFIWEVYGYKNNVLVYSDSGDFDGYNATNNNRVYIVSDYQLTSDNTAFTLYLWLDGSKVDNDIYNGEFQGIIGAETENFTAIINTNQQ